METTKQPLQLDKRSLVKQKITEIPTSFLQITIFFNEAFQYGDGGIFKLLRQMQKLYQ
jgi:hypothetical protein